MREEGPDAGQRRRRQQQHSRVRQRSCARSGSPARRFTRSGSSMRTIRIGTRRCCGGLAQVSGGESFFPKQLSEVIGICRQIASDIRTRYTIGYVPVRSGEQGSLRKIKVTAIDARRAQVGRHTRARAIFFRTDARRWIGMARRAGSVAYETAYYHPGDSPLDRGPILLPGSRDRLPRDLRLCISGAGRVPNL